MAAMVEFGAGSTATSAARIVSTTSEAVPSTGSMALRPRLPVVIVPVLSRHSTSTRAKTSTVESCLANAFLRASRSTPATKARLVSSTRPSGTMATAAATVPRRASCQTSSLLRSETKSSSDATGMTATIHRSTRLMPSRSEEAAVANRRAWIVSWAA